MPWWRSSWPSLAFRYLERVIGGARGGAPRRGAGSSRDGIQSGRAPVAEFYSATGAWPNDEDMSGGGGLGSAPGRPSSRGAPEAASVGGPPPHPGRGGGFPGPGTPNPPTDRRPR